MAFLSVAPTGTVLPFAGSVAPEGWAFCDGSAKSRTGYSKLFAVISTSFGTGDGSTTFNLPDMRGVFPRGSGTNGTANYGGVTGHTPAGGSLSAKGGQKTAKNNLSVAGTAGSNTHTHNMQHTHQTGYKDATYGQLRMTTARSVSAATWNTNGSPVFWSGATATTGGGDYLNPNKGTNSTYYTSRSLDATTNKDLTAGPSATVAPSISSTDSETTPASLTLNYIIKL